MFSFYQQTEATCLENRRHMLHNSASVSDTYYLLEVVLTYKLWNPQWLVCSVRIWGSLWSPQNAFLKSSANPPPPTSTLLTLPFPPQYGCLPTLLLYSHNSSDEVSLFTSSSLQLSDQGPHTQLLSRLLQRCSEAISNIHTMFKLKVIFSPFLWNPFFSSTNYSITISSRPIDPH